MKRFLLVPSMLLLLLACGNSEDAMTEVDTDVVEQEAAMLQVVQEIGVELGDSNFVFGVIQAVDFTADGNLAVLDTQKQKVSVFTPSGEFIGSLGRAGEGPGEFLSPQDLTCFDDGRIAVTDPFSREVEFFGSDLQSIDTFSDFDARAPFVITSAGTGFAGEQGGFNRDAGIITTSVALWEENADTMKVFFELEDDFTPDFILTRIMKPQAGLVSDGLNLYYSTPESEEYTVMVYPLDGSAEFFLSFPGYTAVTKSDEDLQKDIEAYDYRMQAMAAQGRGGRLASVTYEPPSEYFAVKSLGIDAEGNLWVQRGWESNPTFDLFPQGATEPTATIIVNPELELQDFTFVITPEGMAAFNANPDDYPRVLILAL